MLSLAFALLVTVGQASCQTLPTLSLKLAKPEEAGLTWQECAVSRGRFNTGTVNTCSGVPEMVRRMSWNLLFVKNEGEGCHE